LIVVTAVVTLPRNVVLREAEGCEQQQKAGGEIGVPLGTCL